MYPALANRQQANCVREYRGDAFAPPRDSDHPPAAPEVDGGGVFASTAVCWENFLHIPNDTKLLLWYGTALGKTQLLNNAEVTHPSLITGHCVVPSDDLSKASLMHKGSMDLSDAGSLVGNCWVADVHVHEDVDAAKHAKMPRTGGNSPSAVDHRGAAGGGAVSSTATADTDRAEAERQRKLRHRERRADIEGAERGVVPDPAFNFALDVLFEVSLLCLHVDANDFDGLTGDPIAPAVRRVIGRAAVVVWRDFSADDEERDLVQKVRDKYPKAQILTVPNCSQFRSEAKGNTVFRQFRSELVAALTKNLGNWPSLPTPVELEARFQQGVSSSAKSSSQRSVGKSSSSKDGASGAEQQVQAEMLDIIKLARPDFKMKMVNSQLHALEDQERAAQWGDSEKEIDERVETAQQQAILFDQLSENKHVLFGQGFDRLTGFFLDKVLALEEKGGGPRDTWLVEVVGKNKGLAKSLRNKTALSRLQVFSERLCAKWPKEQFDGMEVGGLRGGRKSSSMGWR